MSVLISSFVFGLVNSLHCACMCGPLSFAVQGGVGGALTYHVGRATSYLAIGAMIGSLGQVFGTDELGTPTASVAFTLAAGLLLLALVGERGAMSIPGLGNLLHRAMARTRRWSPATRAGVLGVCTPLLPCGLLWAAFASAAVAGSAFDGGSVMFGFALGSLPLLLLAQTQAGRLAARFGPLALQRVQRTAMLLAAGTLIWQGVRSLQGGSCCQ